MRESAENGHMIGFPIIDFEIKLTDGAYHDVDSSALAFEIAGRAAMREVAAKAGIKLLEPVMKVEVVTPRSEEHTSELQSLMRISYAVFCLKKKTQKKPDE